MHHLPLLELICVHTLALFARIRNVDLLAEGLLFLVLSQVAKTAIDVNTEERDELEV